MLEIYHKREVFIIKIILASTFYFGYYSRSNQNRKRERLEFSCLYFSYRAFVVGTVELIIGGTLDLVANDLGVSISATGQLITIFSVVFALSGAVLLAVTGKFERKTLYVGALSIFLIGNIISAFSVNYGMLMFSRVICEWFINYCTICNTCV